MVMKFLLLINHICRQFIDENITPGFPQTRLNVTTVVADWSIPKDQGSLPLYSVWFPALR